MDVCLLMSWFHVQLLHTTRCNYCRVSTMMENIHEAKMLQSCIFSIMLESLQLLHKKLHINYTSKIVVQLF